MKKRKQLIRLLSIVILLFSLVTACDKTDDTGGDFPSAGTVKDADGNVYNTVKIGTQVWMVDNLKTTKYNDGKAIPNVTDNSEWGNLTKGAYCNFDNLESNAKIAGRLYNWYAVNTGKLAPEGWHVPTEEDWTILEEYLIANGYNYDGTKDENKIAKSMVSKTGWETSSTPGTPGAVPRRNNGTGFTAIPGGYRDGGDGYFYNIGKYGDWWSSTEYNEGYAYYRYLSYYHKGLYRDINDKGNGFSVRLVRD